MNSLYLANCRVLGSYPSYDAKLWHEIHHVIGLNVSLVDRTDTIKMPFNFKIYKEFLMPKLNRYFAKTYEDCCNNRAIELLSMVKAINKPIIVLYSGGIDSTLILVSLMKNCPQNQLRQWVTVALTADSIVENPNFYYDYIRKNFNIISSDTIGSYFDQSSLIVSGEYNDQIFGSDILGSMYREKFYDKINEPYSKDIITAWFVSRGMSPDAADLWFELVDKQIKTRAECEVTTNFHFFWWINFCFKWQSVYFRLLARVDVNMRHYITENFVRQYFHHFYSTTDFQQWSMLNHHRKLVDNWQSYKTEAKQIIYEFNRDSDYLNNKIKIGSLSILFQQKYTADAIDSEFNFIDECCLNPADYYVENNSFI